MAKINIPSPFRKFTAQEANFESKAVTVKGVLDDLTKTYPVLKKNIYNPEGELLQFIRIFRGETDIENLNGLGTEVNESSELTLIPAIAGG
jgi:molybdopterin converting factor small subunit